MRKLQVHAYIAAVIFGLMLLAAKSGEPLVFEGRPNTEFEKIPLELPGWSGMNSKFDEKTYEQLPTCNLLLRYYDERDSRVPIELAIVYGQELGDFHQPEMCLEGQGLRSVARRKVRIRRSDGTSFEAVGLTMEGEYSRRAFVYWFSTQGVTSTFLGDYKVRLLLNRLTARKVQPSAMVRLAAEVRYTDEEAFDQLVRFAEAIVPNLDEEFAAGGS